MSVLWACLQPRPLPTVQLMGFSQLFQDSLSILCWWLLSRLGTSFEGFRKPSDVVHSICLEAVFEFLCCILYISRRFLLSSFFGQAGLKHRFHGRLPNPRTSSSGQPQPLHVLLVVLTVPLCGSGNEVLHTFLK